MACFLMSYRRFEGGQTSQNHRSENFLVKMPVYFTAGIKDPCGEVDRQVEFTRLIRSASLCEEFSEQGEMSMNAKPYRFLRLIATLVGYALFVMGAAQAQTLPRSMTMGSNPPGTVFYALASGLAKFAGEGAPFQIVVQPYTGTSTFLPLLNSGEIDFGINNAVDMALAYQGPERLKIGGRNPFEHTPNARLVMRGSILLTAPLVRKDSPIKTIQDIRGKRVTGEYPAQLAN